MTDRSRIEELVSEHQIQYVCMEFTDILGIVKSYVVPAYGLADVLEEGLWFDGSSVQGFAPLTESDMYLVPDCDTWAVLPWSRESERTARLICDVYTPGGQLFQGAPRSCLKRMLAAIAEDDLAYSVAPEIEFSLFDVDADGKPVLRLRRDRRSVGGGLDPMWRKVVQALDAFGIGIEGEHHDEVTGQHQTDLRLTDALRAADDTLTARSVIKTVAEQRGLYASFLPKPMIDVKGLSMHVHQRLMSTEGDRNLFADASRPYGLSRTAEAFMAGQLEHAPAMMAIVAPLVNSYKRVDSRSDSPLLASWGRSNRATVIRVPHVKEPMGTRIELRLPDSACNPYLAFTAMLAAGMDGVKRRASLRPPTEEGQMQDGRSPRHLKTLPHTLGEALARFAGDATLQDALGSHMVQQYVAAKESEWLDYRLQVTPWEHQRYLSRF